MSPFSNTPSHTKALLGAFPIIEFYQLHATHVQQIAKFLWCYTLGNIDNNAYIEHVVVDCLVKEPVLSFIIVQVR